MCIHPLEKHIYIVKCQRYICIDLDLCDDRHRNGLLSDAATVPRVFSWARMAGGQRPDHSPKFIKHIYIYIIITIALLLYIYIHLKPYKNVGSY